MTGWQITGKSIPAGVFALALLAGCGGGGGSSGPSPAPTPPPTVIEDPQFTEYKNRAIEMGTQDQNGRFSGIPTRDVSGMTDTATMTGFIAAPPAGVATRVLIGDASVTVNFQSGAFSGSASNFGEFALSGGCSPVADSCSGTRLQNLSGSLDIDGGVGGDGDVGFTATGALTGDFAGQREAADVTLVGDGYIGRNGSRDVAVGTIEGTISAGAAIPENVEGIFYLQRN